MRDRNAPLTADAVPGLAWEKMAGLLPAVVQDRAGGQLLMVAYMNAEALEASLESGFATFFSRSKGRLWMKGETSGNRLRVHSIHSDCDDDALLVLAEPEGPVCHLGTKSCFGGEPEGAGWLAELSRIVGEAAERDPKESYTARLLAGGTARIAQKVGEEGVEVALAAVARDSAACAEETADLVYHLAVLMKACGYDWSDVVAILRRRHAGQRRTSMAAS